MEFICIVKAPFFNALYPLANEVEENLENEKAWMQSITSKHLIGTLLDIICSADPRQIYGYANPNKKLITTIL